MFTQCVAGLLLIIGSTRSCPRDGHTNPSKHNLFNSPSEFRMLKTFGLAVSNDNIVCYLHWIHLR